MTDRSNDYGRAAAQGTRPPLDFQLHLKELERQGLLVRVDRSINKDTELHPLVRWQFLGGIPENDRKAFVFTNVLRAGDPADEATVRRVAQLAAARRAVYLPVRLTCDLEVLLDRVQDAERAARHKLTDPDAVRRFTSTATIVDLTAYGALDVDTTDVSPAAAAALILDHCGSLATGASGAVQ